MSRKKTRRTRRSSGLAGTAAEHSSVVKGYARPAVQTARRAQKLAQAGRCTQAVAELVNASYHHGRALTHYAEGSSHSVAAHKKSGIRSAAKAMDVAWQSFRKNCSTGPSRHNAAFGRRS